MLDAGGLDMAVEAVFGGNTVWHCEIDKAASKVLAHRYPGVPNLGDISCVDWEYVKDKFGRIDVLCGGFPCQDVSAAGKRAGIKDGTRSGLWAIFADAIDRLRPTYVVIENVRGLLSAQAHRDMESTDPTVGNGPGRPVLRAAGAVLGDLADLGYDAQWTTVSASGMGAPHRRERVFILAADANCDRSGWRPVTSGRSEPAQSSTTGSRVPLPRSGPDAADAAGNGRHEGRSLALLPTPKASDGTGGCYGGEGHQDTLPGTSRGASTTETSYALGGTRSDDARRQGEVLLPTPRASDTNGAGLHGDGGMDLRTTVTLLPTPRASDPSGAESRSSEGFRPQLGEVSRTLTTAWGKYEPAIRRWENLTRPAPAPTEPNKNGNPRLSAEFSSWMMGWPAGWVTDPAIGISRNDQLRIIGNGVVSQQCAFALRYLLSIAAVV